MASNKVVLVRRRPLSVIRMKCWPAPDPFTRTFLFSWAEYTGVRSPGLPYIRRNMLCFSWKNDRYEDVFNFGHVMTLFRAAFAAPRRAASPRRRRRPLRFERWSNVAWLDVWASRAARLKWIRRDKIMSLVWRVSSDAGNRFEHAIVQRVLRGCAQSDATSWNSIGPVTPPPLPAAPASEIFLVPRHVSLHPWTPGRGKGEIFRRVHWSVPDRGIPPRTAAILLEYAPNLPSTIPDKSLQKFTEATSSNQILSTRFISLFILPTNSSSFSVSFIPPISFPNDLSALVTYLISYYYVLHIIIVIIVVIYYYILSYILFPFVNKLGGAPTIF